MTAEKVSLSPFRAAFNPLMGIDQKPSHKRARTASETSKTSKKLAMIGGEVKFSNEIFEDYHTALYKVLQGHYLQGEVELLLILDSITSIFGYVRQQLAIPGFSTQIFRHILFTMKIPVLLKLSEMLDYNPEIQEGLSIPDLIWETILVGGVIMYHWNKLKPELEEMKETGSWRHEELLALAYTIPAIYGLGPDWT